MKPLLRTACIYALSLVVLGAVYAEQTGEIRGRVTDEQGEALPGVAITARSPKLQGTRTALSDHTGAFRLPLLPVGKYSLTFELPGFEKLITIENEAHLGATLSVSVALKISSVSEEVTVIATNPLIDKTNADNSYRLTGEDLARVPSQARTIAEVVSFTPGVTGVRANMVTGSDTGLPSFRGEGDAGNNWLVDGLSMKGAAFNDPGVRINYDAWEEVQVISDGFAPELGQALGGFVNIVTKSGGNKFHGELGGLIRDSNLRARRRDQLSIASLPETSLSQFFANLGGPVLKDKLWFFLSDNYHRSLDDTEQQSVGWLTIPAGKRRFNTNNLFGKVTFTPQKNHTLSFNGTLDTFLNQTGGIGVPETYTKTDYSDYSYRINYSGILSQNTLLTAVWGQNRRESGEEPLDGDYGPPSYFWQDIAQTTNNSYWSSMYLQRRTDGTLNLTRYLNLGPWGSHELRAGILYYRYNWEVDNRYTGLDFDPWPGNGFDNGVQIKWMAPGIPFALQESGYGVIKNASKGFGFSVHDNFTIGRFSFMLGLRSETQEVFNDMGEEIWSWGLSDFIAPRLTVSFDLLGDSRNILKFGYGQFANPQSLSYLWIFNTRMGFSFRGYDWAGAENPTDAQLKDPSNWAFSWEQSAEAMPMDVDPHLKPNKMTKYLLEFDRQIGKSWALKLRGIYSHSRNLTNIVATYNPEIQWIDLLYTNFELKRRNYKGLEVELNGRVSGRYMLNASYTWSQAKGTNPGSWNDIFTWDSPFGNAYEGSVFGLHPFVPEGEPAKELIDSLFVGLGGRGIGDEGWYGFLPYSVDHLIKILGSYYTPYGFVVSAGIEYLSGYHWEKKGLSPAYGMFSIFPEGRGGRTAPPHMYVDLAVEKEFVLKKNMRLGVGLNAYNLLNSQRAVSFVKEDTELFGRVWGRQLPRWVQLKAALRF
ncbi:MAG: hypothetical protein A2V45_08040 [Candidatus Aminicenantes bacterium RBG_19FT_COMBO_58_17]|nr:MAG: hypothetical protein A2V45_08040 [Candidatus Aminicenantes bacterium RBG_19FT_COMBO_58_17]